MKKAYIQPETYMTRIMQEFNILQSSKPQVQLFNGGKDATTGNKLGIEIVTDPYTTLTDENGNELDEVEVE